MAKPKRIRVFSRERRTIPGRNEPVFIDTVKYEGVERRTNSSDHLEGRRKNGGWRTVRKTDLPILLPGLSKTVAEVKARVILDDYTKLKEKVGEKKARSMFIRNAIQKQMVISYGGQFLGIKIAMGRDSGALTKDYFIAYNPFTGKFWFASTRRVSENMIEKISDKKEYGE